MGTFGASLFIPLFIQGVLGASATLSDGLLAPMVLAMLVTNVATGLAIAHYGRYKAFLLVGFAASAAGFALMATAGRDSWWERRTWRPRTRLACTRWAW